MNKNIWLLLLAKWTSNFGTHFHMLAFPLLVYEKTQSVTLLSLTFIAETLPWLLIGPVIPHLIKNRFSPKAILLYCDFFRFIIVLGTIYFIDHTWIVLSLIFILGTLNSIHGSFRTSIVKSNTDDITLKTTLGISLGIDDVISMIAPVLGALMISNGVSSFNLLLLDALTYLMSAILLIGVKSERYTGEEATQEKQYFVREVTRGFHIIWNHPQLRWLATIEGIRSLVEGISIPLLMLYVVDVLSSSDATFAWSRALSAACAILASLFYIKWSLKISTEKFTKVGTIILIASMAIFSVIHHTVLFFIASALLGLGMAIRQLVSENLLIQVTPARDLPEVASAFNAAISSFYVIGYAISILPEQGIPVTYFFALSAVLLIAGHVLTVGKRSINDSEERSNGTQVNL
ncbi:MFS transporter [Paenibacillus sp. FSL R7-0345]|uniref:MFS transporter n=1 Tax=Paenibacillus sp. FSL R7-0345 TaxID=2954535 RepID=UPI00315B396B